MKENEFHKKAEEFIKSNKIQETFELFREFITQKGKKKSDIYYDLILLESQWNKNSRNWNLNIESDKEEYNKIVFALTKILQKLDSEQFGSVKEIIEYKEKRQINWFYALIPFLLFGIGCLMVHQFFLKKDELLQGINENKKYMSVSANKLWTNTEVEVNPGETVRVKATGLVNMALHRVMTAADEDVRPKFAWNGPKGLDYMPKGPLYRRRRELLVLPQAPYGCLLFHASIEGEPDPNKEYPSPPNIKVVKDGFTYTHPKDSKKKAVIFLTCNDTVLKKEPKYKDSFVGTQEEVNQTYGFKLENGVRVPRYKVEDLEKRWDRLINDRYWEIWFDDNGGNFLVEIESINE